MKRRFLSLLLCVFLGANTGIVSQAFESQPKSVTIPVRDSLMVKTAHSVETLSPTSEPNGDSIDLLAARGEYESAQVVIESHQPLCVVEGEQPDSWSRLFRCTAAYRRIRRQGLDRSYLRRQSHACGDLFLSASDSLRLVPPYRRLYDRRQRRLSDR